MIKPSGRDSRVALLKHFNWTATATDEAGVKAEQGKAVTSLGSQVRVYLTNPEVFTYLNSKFGAAAQAVLAGSRPAIGPELTPAQVADSVRNNNARLAREPRAAGTSIETGVIVINVWPHVLYLSGVRFQVHPHAHAWLSGRNVP